MSSAHSYDDEEDHRPSPINLNRRHDSSTSSTADLSAHSSPRPESTSDLGHSSTTTTTTDHQREQDVHLAQSMARPSFLLSNNSTSSASALGGTHGRTRSNTTTAATAGTNASSSTTIIGHSPAQAQTMAMAMAMGSSPSSGQHNNELNQTPQRSNTNDHHSISRRRNSLSQQQQQQQQSTSTMDHLADDLQIQAQRDHRQHHHESSTSSSSRPGPPPLSPAGPTPTRYSSNAPRGPNTPIAASLQHSAAAARLYRHHRNVSESSLDSQGGAYIDHRRQPHSLAGLVPSSASASAGAARFAVGASASVLERAGIGLGHSPEGRYDGINRSLTSPSGGAAARRTGSSNDGRRDRGAGSDQEIDDFSIGQSGYHGLDSSDLTHSGISSRTARNELTSADLEEHALALSGDDRDDPRAHLERHASHHSYRSNTSTNQHDDHDRHYDNELSRRGSFAGQPEDDICFPAHGAAAEVDLIDMGLIDHHQQHHHHHHYSDHHDHHYNNGVAGVLPNFPYPFDFGALEDFAEREKEGMPIPGMKRRKGTNVSQQPNTIQGTSPPNYGVSSATNRSTNLAFSSGSESGFTGRTRQRKLSESVAPGRYRRKLALFEGAGAGEETGSPRGANTGRGDGGSSSGGGIGGMLGSILDTKTPLLDKNSTANNGYGSRGGPTAATGGTASSGARPYRFSFYSNALPSTIHARSLAEIPAEGQTFEELFVGHSSPAATAVDEETSFRQSTQSAADPRLTFSPPSRSGSGTHTPAESTTHHTTTNATNVNGATTSGARPSGIPHAAAAAQAAKARSNLMRSDVDAEANTWWLDVLCPTDQEMKVLSKVFGIHPLTTEDIQMEETREKIELFRNYYFVCFRSFEQDPYSPTYLEPLNMYIIVFREGTLSFHFRGTPHPQQVRRRIKQLKDYINVTSDWISYALIDDITDAFGPLIQNIEYEVDSIDELVLILKEAEQSDMLRRIGTCRKKVMGLLRLMGNKADVVKGLSKRCNENWSVAPKSDIGLYLSDIQDHITTSTQNLTHYEKILSRSHSNYLAQISIEMTDANNQINDVLSKLTALGTVLIPMNLITGLWGMNVHVPGEGGTTLHWFFSILGCLGAIAVGGAWLTYKVFVRSN